MLALYQSSLSLSLSKAKQSLREEPLITKRTIHSDEYLLYFTCRQVFLLFTCFPLDSQSQALATLSHICFRVSENIRLNL